MIQFPRVPIPAGATAAHAAHTGDRTTTRRTPRDPLAYLGHDVFLNIAGQMNTVDLVAASQVCTAWRGKLLATTETWRAASRRSKVERLVPMPPAPNDGRTADFATMHQSALAHARMERAWDTQPRTVVQGPLASPTHIQVDSLSGVILAGYRDKWCLYDSSTFRLLWSFDVDVALRKHVALSNGFLVYPVINPPVDGAPIQWEYCVCRIQRRPGQPLIHHVQTIPDTTEVMLRPWGAWGGWALSAGGWGQPPWFVSALEDGTSTHMRVHSWNAGQLGDAVQYTHSMRHGQSFEHLRLPIFQSDHHISLYPDRATVYSHPPEESPNDPCQRIAIWPQRSAPLPSIAFPIHRAIYNAAGLPILNSSTASISVRGFRTGSLGYEVAMGEKTNMVPAAKLACYNDRDLIIAAYRSCVLVLTDFHATTACLRTLSQAERASYLSKRTVLLDFKLSVEDIAAYGDRFAVALSDGNVVVIDSRKISTAVALSELELSCVVLDGLFQHRNPAVSDLWSSYGGRVNYRLLMDARALYIVDHRRNRLTAYRLF